MAAHEQRVAFDCVDLARPRVRDHHGKPRQSKENHGQHIKAHEQESHERIEGEKHDSKPEERRRYPLDEVALLHVARRLAR